MLGGNGCALGTTDGAGVGCADGAGVGCPDGAGVGCPDGAGVGCPEGAVLGLTEGDTVSRIEGVALGFPDGRIVGFALNTICDGLAVGSLLGECVSVEGLSEGTLIEVFVAGFRVNAAVGLLEAVGLLDGPDGREVGELDGPV